MAPVKPSASLSQHLLRVAVVSERVVVAMLDLILDGIEIVEVVPAVRKSHVLGVDLLNVQ